MEYFRKAGQKSEVEAGSGGFAKLTEKTANSIKETTNGIKRRLIYGGEIDKHIRLIVITSAFVFAVLYCIVILSRMLLGQFSV